MTLIFLRIDNQLQIVVGLKFITGTKDFMVKTESTNNDQIKTFIAHLDQLIILLLKLYSKTLLQLTSIARTECFERI